MLAGLDDEAKLSPSGREALAGQLVGALSNRLQLRELIRRHPEIEDEKVDVAAFIVGLPRTGSTLLHRLLGTMPPFTGILWWELQYPFPHPDGRDGGRTGRRAAANEIMQAWLRGAPELTSITPIELDQPDEELLLMDQSFLFSGWEGMHYLPGFSAYVEAADKTPSYRELVTALKCLQWQAAERRGKRWILKSPGHLSALREVTTLFPEARIIMQHRDPVETLPSYCSMETTLYGIASDRVDPVAIGAHWYAKLRRLLESYIRHRDAIGEQRFIDIQYRELTRDMDGQVRRIMTHLGEVMTPEVEAALADVVADNARDKRPPHQYRADRFGFTRTDIERDFAFYRERFGFAAQPVSGAAA
ncbi:putative sulfotransferase [Sphingomonas sp. DBB INV C78]